MLELLGLGLYDRQTPPSAAAAAAAAAYHRAAPPRRTLREDVWWCVRNPICAEWFVQAWLL